MEALGQKLKQARLARKITLEEASRVTKIRPSRIAEIEQEDFSSFASLAYAKGFLLIYGKYLDVDVTPYLDAFEVSDRVTVDGYSYLQDSGPSAPPSIVRRQSRKSPTFVPFIFAIALLVIGLYLIKLFLNIQRIAPAAPEAAPAASITASATPGIPSSTSAGIVAPRAQPVEGPPASEAMVTPLGTPLPSATPTPTEPEVRRALPVHPENLPPTPSPR
ncbi:MAG: helix-turn-helix domain-containing protein [Chthoniobacterales bacterium]